MSEWSDKAFILRYGQFHETDMWLKMLCKKHGLRTVFAFGASVSKRRFCGCLDLFNTLQCKIKSSRNGKYLNLQEAILESGPVRMRQNWQIVGIGTNCLRFMEAVNIDETSSQECFAVLENLRATLENNRVLPWLMPQFFRLRVAAILGFSPEFFFCGKCGHEIAGNVFFDVNEGSALCKNCQLPTNHQLVPVSPTALQALRKVSRSGPDQWTEGSLTPADRRSCSRIIDGFIAYHLGLAWDNGFFRHV